jgi:hypothetical protein
MEHTTAGGADAKDPVRALPSPTLPTIFAREIAGCETPPRLGSADVVHVVGLAVAQRPA